MVPDDRALYWHQLAEVVKQAWRDRLRYVGDPDFVDVPVERLLSKDYAAGRVEALQQFPEQVRSTSVRSLGSSRRRNPARFSRRRRGQSRRHHHHPRRSFWLLSHRTGHRHYPRPRHVPFGSLAPAGPIL